MPTYVVPIKLELREKSTDDAMRRAMMIVEAAQRALENDALKDSLKGIFPKLAVYGSIVVIDPMSLTKEQNDSATMNTDANAMATERALAETMALVSNEHDMKIITATLETVANTLQSFTQILTDHASIDIMGEVILLMAQGARDSVQMKEVKDD
jgi:hypothetical protein